MSSRKAAGGGSRKRKAQANQDELSVHTAPPSSAPPNVTTANPNAAVVAAATATDLNAPPPAKRAKKMRDPSIITYVGPEGKIFERIFQESLTLEQMKTIVRKKMKYPEGLDIELAQLRYEPGRGGRDGVKTIDLDDEEDFDVFRYRASDPHAPITISFQPGNAPASVSTLAGSFQTLTPRALPPPPTSSSANKTIRPASQSTTLLSALPKPVLNLSSSSNNTNASGTTEVASPKQPSAKKKTQFAPTPAPRTPVAPSTSVLSSNSAGPGLAAPASAPPVLKTSRKRNTSSQSAAKGPMLEFEPEPTPSVSASAPAPTLTPTPAPAAVDTAKTHTPAEAPTTTKTPTPAASQKGTGKEVGSKTPSKAATTSEKPAKRRKTSTVPPVSTPVPAVSPVASATSAIIAPAPPSSTPASAPAPSSASVSKHMPTPTPAQKAPQLPSLAPPIYLPKSRKSLPAPSTQPISISDKEKVTEGENDKSWEAEKWLPPTLAAAVARRKSMGATPLALELDFPSSSLASVTSDAVTTSEKDQEKEKEPEKEKKEKRKSTVGKPISSPKKQASTQSQNALSPAANSVELGLPSSYEFGKEKEVDESSENEAPATLTPAHNTKGKLPPTPKQPSNLPAPVPVSPINPPTPNQQRTPLKARSMTPLSSPAGPVAPSSPEKQPHSDVYIEDDGEGSTSESSSDDSSDDEEESEEKEKEKSGKKEEQEKNVLAPSSSLPNGLKHALPPPRFSGAPLRPAIDSDDDEEDDDSEDDDDDVVHYSDATDSPPKKKRASMLSQGRGRKSGAFSESEDDEGILPPGVKDPDAETEERQGNGEGEEEEEEADPIVEEPADLQNGAQKRVQSETIESWSDQGLDSESGSVLVVSGRVNDPPRVLISSPSVRSNESSPEPTWEEPPVQVSTVTDAPAVETTPKPRKSLGDLEELDASQPPLTFSTLNRALDEAGELDRVDGNSNDSQAIGSGNQEPEKEEEEKEEEDKDEDDDVDREPPILRASTRGRPIGGDVSRKTSSSSSLIARREEVEVENQVSEGDYPESEPPSSIQSRFAPSLPPSSSAVNTPSATPRTLTKAEQIRNRRAELVAEKAAAARVKAEEVAAKHEIAIENARKKGKPLSKMLLNYLEKKKKKEEEERAKEEAHADLAILRAGAKQIENQRSVGRESLGNSDLKQAEEEPVTVVDGKVQDTVDETLKVQETPAKSARPTEDKSASVSKPTPSNSPQTSLPYSRNRASQPRPSISATTSATPSLYPSIPLPPPSQPVALPSSSQRRAPGLSDLSQRSKAEFAVAGSETARAKAAGRESGVLGRIGGWISGSARSTPIGKQSGVALDPESESSDDDDDDEEDEDSSSSEEEGGKRGQSKAVKQAVKARMASGRKVGKPKKSILGSLM
ncbi:hypothetical protein [Phaffia rhodozyma]|uniref:Uncharacterized protein n=1 Tax=Phaffia rhodozyma TaxID=264483 RepID=A0A0F7SK67_PHARH|nr:hypothetical protein [Phaffia rhodozyma]